MSRALVIDVSKTLPPRPRAVSPETLANIHGGRFAQGHSGTVAADCCQVRLQPGDDVLCDFYRGQGIASGSLHQVVGGVRNVMSCS